VKKDKFRVRVSLHIRQIVVITLGFLNCQPAVARMGYFATVTNVIDGNSVVIADRQFGRWRHTIPPYIVRLDGIVAPERTNSFGVESCKRLSELVLNKKLHFLEELEGDVSHGACIFFMRDNDMRYTDDDCVNLIMVRDGMARWTGRFMSRGISVQKMEEAQRQAQAERKGIWKLLNASPTDSEPPLTSVAITSSVKAVSQKLTVPATPAHTNAPPVAENPSADSLPSCPLCPAVLLAVGGGVLAALLLWRGLRKRKQ
jgi:endonuclease YncB( thermonuclease family)